MFKKKSVIAFFSLLLVIIGITTVSATNYTDHIHKGGYNASDAKNLSVQLQDGVAVQGLTSIVKSALNKMTATSSKLGWHESSSMNAKIAVNAGPSSADNYGSASYYCLTLGFVNPCNKDETSKARYRTYISLNTRTMNEDDFTYDNKLKTTLHEVGHALSLGHVTSGASVMRSGKLSYTEPQDMDEDHLQYKWGK